jgi:two-component system KDP operon response regulator KdpE
MAPKILVVDDDPDLRRLLHLELKAAGYDTAFARDAISMIKIAREEQPDLILLDLGLPGGDGFVCIERLKTFPALEAVPIVVVSARDPAHNRDRALSLGAQAYLHKPFDPDDLLETIGRYVGAANS